MVIGLGFRVQGSGLKVQELKIWDLELRDQGSGSRGWIKGLRVKGFEFTATNLAFARSTSVSIAILFAVKSCPTPTTPTMFPATFRLG